MICRRRAANTIGHLVLLVCWLHLVPKALPQASISEKHLRHGVAYLEQGKYERAVQELQKAAQLSPQSYASHYNLGLALWNLRKLDAAFNAFQRAHRLQPKEANSRYYLGRIYLARGDHTSAIRLLESLVQNSDPRIADEHYQLGLAYLKAGNPEAAVEVLRQASHFSPQDANVYQALARAFQALGKSEETEKAFALSSRLRSEDLEASQLLHLCRQQLEARDVGKAIETGQRLCRLSSVEHLVELGVLFGQSGLVEEALEPLQKAVSLDPNRFEARFNLAYALVNLQRHQESEEHLLEAMRLKPQSFEVHSLLGVVRSHLKKNLPAIESFRKAVELQPNDSRIPSLLALQYLEGSYYEEAIQSLSKAIKRNPADPTLRFLLIQAHHKNQDSVKALEQAKLAAKQFPELARAHYELGFQLASFGRFEESKPEFERALRLDPAYPEAHYSLGDLLLKQGHNGLALEHFQKALAGNPALIEAHVGLGKALLALQRHADVVREMEKAIALEPSEPQLRYNLAQAYRGLGQTEKTQLELKTFNRLNQERMKQKDREVPRKFPR